MEVGPATKPIVLVHYILMQALNPPGRLPQKLERTIIIYGQDMMAKELVAAPPLLNTHLSILIKLLERMDTFHHSSFV